MNNDNELDEILASIKKHRLDEENKPLEVPLEPPKPISPPAPKIEKIAKPAPLPEPKPEPQKKQKAKKDKKDKSAYGFNAKIGATLFCLIAIAIAINVGLSAIFVGPIRSYEKKYGVHYPKGIQSEFCDVYGKNQAVIGKLCFSDLDNKDVFVFDETEEINHIEYGSSFDVPQQFRAISLRKSYADLESIYRDASSYEKLSQKVEYTSIFGKRKTYQVFACYYVTTNPKDDNDYQFPYNLYGDLVEEDFDKFEDAIGTRSLYKTGYDMSYFDSFLTISVDSEYMDDFRFVIVCVQTKSKLEPITQTSENINIHYPQIWYDKNDEHNSYWLSYGWEPSIYTDETHTSTEALSFK